ncbi:hypothetical protein ACFWAP_33605 [Streptomyces goshikiensis]|uniref:hypothetical protein n=1 Tax=Streptomyces goshikiensis TaxID=1942 RepID=UPI0036649762
MSATTSARKAPAKRTKPAPKVTLAQRGALLSIRDKSMKLREDRSGRWIDTLHVIHVPRRDTLERVIAKGWAQLDTEASLLDGQAITLTALGRTVLAG